MTARTFPLPQPAAGARILCALMGAVFLAGCEEQNFGMAETRAGAALLARSGLANGLLLQALPGVAGDLRFIEQAMSRGGHPVKAVAHCFCMP